MKSLLNREEAGGRPLSEFTVELDVYSGPYEWLLALILKDEVEIFEVPLKELIDLYLNSRESSSPDNTLERDAEFASSASSLVLLKSRTLLPLFEPESGEDDGEAIEPDELARKLAAYLRIKRGASVIGRAMDDGAGRYPTNHELTLRPGRVRVDRRRLDLSARRLFSRLEEPAVSHLGTISVTVQELAALIRSSLSSGKVSFETLTRDMDRLHVAVAFTAALSLANEGSLSLHQDEPLGPLTLEPINLTESATS